MELDLDAFCRKTIISTFCESKIPTTQYKNFHLFSLFFLGGKKLLFIFLVKLIRVLFYKWDTSAKKILHVMEGSNCLIKVAHLS